MSTNSAATNQPTKKTMKANKTNNAEAVLPFALFRRLKLCEVSSLACDQQGGVVTSLRSYKGRCLRSRLTVVLVSPSEMLVHRCAALLLLQSGGKASFYRSRNLGGVVGRVSLPCGVKFVVEDC